jgi:cytoplasmic membrane protein
MKLDAKILTDLEQWYEKLSPLSLKDFINDKGDDTAVISVDMINGFCKRGCLASPRINAVADNVARTFNIARKSGIKNMILLQDRHEPGSAEFRAFPPHAVIGTDEAEPIGEIKNLSFFNEMKIFYKNSLSAAYCDDFNAFLKQNPQISKFIILGDCSDFCVYNLILHLKLEANEKNINREVAVIEDSVQTFDAPGHDGDFYHLVFLHHAQIAANAKIYKTLTE